MSRAAAILWVSHGDRAVVPWHFLRHDTVAKRYSRSCQIADSCRWGWSIGAVP